MLSKKLLLFIFLIVLSSTLAQTVYASIWTTAQDGNWTDANTWAEAGFPTSLDDEVEISHYVNISSNEQANATNITINSSGTLYIYAGANITFNDSTGSGFGASAGDLISSGNATDWVIITSNNTPPTNYWDFYSSTWSVTADYTTFEHFVNYRSASTDIDNSIFRNASDVTMIYLWTSIPSFSNNTINVSASQTAGILSLGIAAIIIKNVTISGTCSGNHVVPATTTRWEFINSSWDFSKIKSAYTNQLVISKNHNDVPGEYLIYVKGTQSKSTITNDFTSSDNVTLSWGGGEFQVNEDGSLNNLTISSGMTLNITGNSNLTSYGYLILDGNFKIENGSAINMIGTGMNYTNFTLNNASNIQVFDWGTIPADLDNTTGKAVNITNISASAYADLNITYNASDIGDLNESKLRIFRYNDSDSSWTLESNTGVNTTAKIVWAENLTTFSIFAVAEAGTPPIITNISNTPNTLDDLDPNVTINVSANVTDDTGLANITLQYTPNGTEWTNTSMTNASNDIYWATFTPDEAGNWTYRIYANDTFGNTNISENTTLEIAYDYTWDISNTSFGVVSAGIGDNTTLINLTINNTGDYPLQFNLSETPQTVPTITFNITSIDIANKSIYTIEINGTAPLVAAVYEVSINITSNLTANPPYNYTNGTFIARPSGPFLYTTIDYTNATVVQGGTITLNAKVQNYGNETATGSWLNWNVPTDWALTDTNASLANLVEREIGWNNLTATISSTASTGSKTVTAHPGCSGCLANQTSNATATVVVTNASTGNGGSGGGGGGGGEPSVEAEIDEIYELVRGENDSFSLLIENPSQDGNLENITINVTGFLAQYIRIVPSRINTIGINESKTVTVYIEAPPYFTEGNHTLVFTITGNVDKGTAGVSRYTETRNILLVIYETSKQEALNLLQESTAFVNELKEIGFYTKTVEELLENLKGSYESGAFKNVIELYKQIKENRDNAFDANATLTSLGSSIQSAEDMGAKVPQAKRLFSLSLTAFNRGDFSTALSRANNAQLIYAIETKGFISLVYFLNSNWKQIILWSVVVLGSIPLIGVGAELAFINYKLGAYSKEEQILLGLMKQVQRECFDEKKMSMSEYGVAMVQYEKRLNKVVQGSLKFESRKKKFFSLKRAGIRLREENEKLLQLIKQTQEKYIEKGDLETRIYQDKMKSFTARMGEIEEKLALMEAQKAIKKSTLGGRIRPKSK